MHNLDRPAGGSARNGGETMDVLVCGGGAAGIGAALGAVKAGARVLMVERGPCLGGAATLRGVASYCGIFSCGKEPRKIVGGVCDELMTQLHEAEATEALPYRHRGVFQVIDPELAKVALDRLCDRPGLELLLHTTVVSAERSSSDTISSVTIREPGGRQRRIHAAAYVDASGDGDLAAQAEASCRFGDGKQVNLGSLATRFTGFAPDAQPTAKLWSDAIVAAKAEDLYLDKMLRKNGSVMLKLPCGDRVSFLASAYYDAREGRSITRAEQEGRLQAQLYLGILRKLPGHQNLRLVSTGPNFGTRESRRVNCAYKITEDDVRTGRKFHDSIALCGWGMEYHDVEHPDWVSSFELPGGDFDLFDIPLRSLCSVDTANLFVAGRLVDGDRYGGAAVRVMGTALATGQAAGVAAALKGKGKMEAERVQQMLREQGALLDRSQVGGMVETLQS